MSSYDDHGNLPSTPWWVVLLTVLFIIGCIAVLMHRSTNLPTYDEYRAQQVLGEARCRSAFITDFPLPADQIIMNVALDDTDVKHCYIRICKLTKGWQTKNTYMPDQGKCGDDDIRKEFFLP